MTDPKSTHKVFAYIPPPLLSFWQSINVLLIILCLCLICLVVLLDYEDMEILISYTTIHLSPEALIVSSNVKITDLKILIFGMIS